MAESSWLRLRVRTVRMRMPATMPKLTTATDASVSTATSRRRSLSLRAFLRRL